MNDIFLYITANSDKIGYAILAIHGVAVAITNLTPTPVDNAFVKRSYKVVEFAAGILTRRAKQ